ncbi:MAG: hypothetical protein R2865_07005 [Deinococcales bacterium]
MWRLIISFLPNRFLVSLHLPLMKVRVIVTPQEYLFSAIEPLAYKNLTKLERQLFRRFRHMVRLSTFTERYTIRNSLELTALSNFRTAAFELGHELDFLFRNELKYSFNYDGIFIRALTDPLNTSYVVARLAELYGKRVLDDSESIRICCDKINMYKHLQRHKVSMPETCYLAEKRSPKLGRVSFLS